MSKHTRSNQNNSAVSCISEQYCGALSVKPFIIKKQSSVDDESSVIIQIELPYLSFLVPVKIEFVTTISPAVHLK